MRRLSEDEQALFGVMSRQIHAHRRRNLVLSQYADGEALAAAWRYRLPEGGAVPQVPLFWPEKAIEVFASRLRPRGFAMESAGLLRDLDDVYEGVDSAAGLVESLAILAALRHGPGFVFTSAGGPGEPQVVNASVSALNGTCVRDPRTWRVTAALELLPEGRANMYLPGRVMLVERGMFPAVLDEYPTGHERVLCAPFVHGMTTERPFGSSRITKSVMGMTDAAMRTFMRQEVSAEWYQNPREKLRGVDPSAFEGEGAGFVSRPGGIDAIPDIHPDDEPDIPDSLRRAAWDVFPQMSMQPFSDQFRLIASQFSGASSIPLQYLGIVQDSNPTSAAAIEAQDVDLVRAVEAKVPAFSWARKALAVNILTVLHGDLAAGAVRGLTPRWEDPRHRGVSEQGQFVAQQVQVGNLQAGSPVTLGLLPIPAEAAKAAAEDARRARSEAMVAALTQAGAVEDAGVG